MAPATTQFCSTPRLPLALILALVFTSIAHLSFVSSLAVEEENALNDLCMALKPAAWSCGNASGAGLCNWPGVTCDRALEHIRAISLQALNLSGELPSSLGSFPMLEHLYLNKNAIYGSIPSQFDKLQNIREMCSSTYFVLMRDLFLSPLF